MILWINKVGMGEEACMYVFFTFFYTHINPTYSAVVLLRTLRLTRIIAGFRSWFWNVFFHEKDTITNNHDEMAVDSNIIGQCWWLFVCWFLFPSIPYHCWLLSPSIDGQYGGFSTWGRPKIDGSKPRFRSGAPVKGENSDSAVAEGVRQATTVEKPLDWWELKDSLCWIEKPLDWWYNWYNWRIPYVGWWELWLFHQPWSCRVRNDGIDHIWIPMTAKMK